MAGSNPAMIVRVAATIEELKANLAQGRTQIETTTAAMGKLATSFQGDKLIQQANNVAAAVNQIGGASRLTEAEQARVNRTLEAALEKYRVLGREAPAAMRQLAEETKNAGTAGESWTAALGGASQVLGALGIGLSIGTVVSLGRAILDDADALMKLHDQTGISVEGLQRFQTVGDEAGNSIDEITAAVIKMQDNLAGGDKNALAALERIGVSFADIKNLSPEQQFIAISDAIRQVQDPSQQVNAAIDILGKTGARVLPTLKQGFDDVKNSAVGMSAPTIAAIDSLGDSLGHLERTGKGLAATALGQVFFGWAYEAKATADQLKNVPPPVLATAKAAGALTLSLADTKSAEDDLTDSAKKSIAEHTKLNAAMAELNSVGQGWKGTLDTIDGTIVEAIKFYMQAGVAQSALATAYGLTDAQVKAIATSMRAEADATKAATDATNALIAARAKQLAQMDEEEEKRKQKIAAMEKEKQALEAVKKAEREKGGSMEYDLSTPEGMLAFQKANPGASVSVGPEYFKTHTLAQALAAGLIDLYAAFKGFMGMAKLPGLATGAANYPGGWAMVGELGPEQMWVPPGANVYPTGSSAGPSADRAEWDRLNEQQAAMWLAAGRVVTQEQQKIIDLMEPLTPEGFGKIASSVQPITNNITVNVTQPFGTPAAIAAAVDDAVMKRMRNIGVRF